VPDLQSESGPIQGLMRFSHQAMATTFEVLACHPRPAYAGQAANEAFALLDRLEQQLSRFIENSDVSRINASRPGEPVMVGPETFECLRQAWVAWELTGGVFDVTMGTWTASCGEVLNTPEIGMTLLHLNESTLSVTRLAEQIRLDLGGIGKGFALDRMAQVLGEWGVNKALLHGGASTVLALDAPPGTKGWPVTVSCPFETTKALAHFDLSRRAMSGSSQISQRHILDPNTGQYPEAQPFTWSCAPSGALADALSTAFVIMGPLQLADLCTKNPAIGAVLVQRTSDKGEVCQAQSLGLWPGGNSQIICRCPGGSPTHGPGADGSGSGPTGPA
jgi:thiamine biosynthesis lipoprotein